MRKAVTTASAFAPAHITGFFEICDSSKNPLLKGSRGAGISLSKGVFARVRLAKGRNNGLEIRINGKASRAPVSRAVLRHFAGKGFAWSGKLQVEHKVQVPMGSGFGTSGAGALSLALAMNSLLGNKMTETEAARIAHLAELECRTGLGTVIGEFVGGFEARTKAGAPGIGTVVKLPIESLGKPMSAKPIRSQEGFASDLEWPNAHFSNPTISKNTEIVCLWFGPVSKPAALSSPGFRKAVNAAGHGRVQKLLKNPALFLELSRKFAESLPGLITPRMRRVLDECDKAGIRCSAMMIGHTLFTLVARNKDGKKRVLLGIFKRNAGKKGKIILTKIDSRGARLV